MSIGSIRVKFVNATQTEIEFLFVPGSGDTRIASGGFLFFGPSDSFDPTQPKLGFPNSSRVMGPTANRFATSLNPSVPQGTEYYFVCGVEFEDGTTEVSDVQKQVNAPAQGAAATEVSLGAASQEIPMGGNVEITVTALANGQGTAGRMASFGFKTGSIRGTFAPIGPVPTGADGKARVLYTPEQPGNSQIEAEVDGLSAGFKIKVKN